MLGASIHIPEGSPVGSLRCLVGTLHPAGPGSAAPCSARAEPGSTEPALNKPALHPAPLSPLVLIPAMPTAASPPSVNPDKSWPEPGAQDVLCLLDRWAAVALVLVTLGSQMNAAAE